MQVRPEHPSDHDGVRQLNVAAFDTGEEAAIVDRLRTEAEGIISLVAVLGDLVVGHIMFSPVTLDPHSDAALVALGPMAVLPSQQRSGIGSALVVSGLDQCKMLGVDAVIVLGHPTYYPRFGFRPASEFGIRCPFAVADEAFMVLQSRADSLLGVAGEVRYHEAFGS